MDISNRTSLLLELSKTADIARPVVVDTARRTRKILTLEERKEKLKAIQRGLSSLGPVTYSAEQKRLLASYKDLFDNWDNYAEYINKPMQELGDWVANKTIVPAIKGVMSLTEGAKEHEVPVPSKPDRAKAIKELEKAGSNITELRHFKQTYAALNNNEFYKIASPKMALEDISSAFEKEFDNSINIFHKKFADEYGKDTTLDHDAYSKLYELAVAHHILTQEGHLKDAKIIDDFIIKNAGLWSWTKGKAKGAWRATKKAVRSGIKYVGKAVKVVGKALVKGVAAIGRIALKGIKFLVSKLPFIGIIFSLPFMIKNLIEAWENGKRILFTLDLKKFGFEPVACITPVGVTHVRDTYKRAVDKFKPDPDALKELLVIFRSIGAFWIDVLFAITNGFMAILDAIAIAGLFFPGIGWLVSAGAMGGSFLLAAGVAGLEIGAEYFQDEYWERDEGYMMEEAKKEVQKILSSGTAAAPEDDGFSISRANPSDEDSDEDDGFVINRSKPSTSNTNPDVIETSEKFDPKQTPAIPLAA
jgi:hypothetical protein